MKIKSLFLSAVVLLMIVFSASGCFLDETSDNTPSGETIKIRVSGTSMEPTIHDGEIITVSCTDESYNYSVGEIIAFKINLTDDFYMVHRIERKVNYTGRMGFITKGDNMDEEDEWVIYPENIAGIYKKVY